MSNIVAKHNLRFMQQLAMVLDRHYATRKQVAQAIGGNPSAAYVGRWANDRVPGVGVYLAMCAQLPGEAGRLMRALVECGGATAVNLTDAPTKTAREAMQEAIAAITAAHVALRGVGTDDSLSDRITRTLRSQAAQQVVAAIEQLRLTLACLEESDFPSIRRKARAPGSLDMVDST